MISPSTKLKPSRSDLVVQVDCGISTSQINFTVCGSYGSTDHSFRGKSLMANIETKLAIEKRAKAYRKLILSDNKLKEFHPEALKRAVELDPSNPNNRVFIHRLLNFQHSSNNLPERDQEHVNHSMSAVIEAIKNLHKEDQKRFVNSLVSQIRRNKISGYLESGVVASILELLSEIGIPQSLQQKLDRFVTRKEPSIW
ncbi:MAG: hypothetical protein KDD56_04220 [Bdellovibrionales bacterium]|nr:hypothetical protein [Bdellovibrionales bacterium]